MKHTEDDTKVLVEKKDNSLFIIILIILCIAGFIIGYYYPLFLNPQSSASPAITLTGEELNSDQSEKTVVLPLPPPTNALEGEITITKDIVEIQKRYSDNFVDAATSSSVLTEEKIRTNETGVAKITFDTISQVTLNPKSSVSFISLIPESFLLRQLLGNVNYIIEKPISIRVADTLSYIENGVISISLEEDTGLVYIDIASGSGTIAFIDNTNETNVHSFSEGDSIIYDPEHTSIVFN